MTDKRMSLADVVGELRDGMTVGVGGWGSRRKPMALIREILRSPVRDLTIVSYGGPDVYFDDLMCQAAARAFVTCERIVDTAEFAKEGSFHTQRISRVWTAGVVETPNGAHFTSCVPDYERDEAFQREYAKSAASPEAWSEFRAAWIDVDEAGYQAKLSAR